MINIMNFMFFNALLLNNLLCFTFLYHLKKTFKNTREVDISMIGLEMIKDTISTINITRQRIRNFYFL